MDQEAAAEEERRLAYTAGWASPPVMVVSDSDSVEDLTVGCVAPRSLDGISPPGPQLAESRRRAGRACREQEESRSSAGGVLGELVESRRSQRRAC